MNKFFDALLWSATGIGAFIFFWMATHNCYMFKSDAMLCTAHAFDFWSVFNK